MNDLLRIVHATPRYVVIDKPSGLLSVPGKGEAKQDCAAARVRTMFPGSRGPLVVHRLDMETSGLLIFGLDEDAQRDLSGQFERREVTKHYAALLEGDVPGDAGVVDLPVRADITRRPVQIVDYVHGRAARTSWRVLSRETDRTRVHFEPLTGRTHQLRVHSAAPRPGGLGCPIVGDALYGTGAAAPRLMLHATHLALREPGGGPLVQFRSVAPF